MLVNECPGKNIVHNIAMYVCWGFTFYFSINFFFFLKVLWTWIIHLLHLCAEHLYKFWIM